MFAHSAVPIDFDSAEIKSEATKLRKARYPGVLFDEIDFEDQTEARREFVLSCIQVQLDISKSLGDVAAFISRISDGLALLSLRDKSD